MYEDHWMNLTHCEELIEPVYSGTPSFIDYNGVNRGAAPGPWHVIGGYTQESSGVNPNWNNNDPNNPAIAYFTTCVDGDPVNLQYNTYDVIAFTLRAPLTDTLDTQLETVTEFHSSSNEDFYGFYVTNARNEFIGDALIIGDAYIHSKAFHEGYLPGTNKKIWDYQTTSAVEPTSGFDFTLKEFLVSTKETSTYEYNTFEMSGVIGGFVIGDNFFVTGKLSTTAVKSDIYRAYWTELETGEDAFESFDCGVYRNGVLLSDNNYSRYVA